MNFVDDGLFPYADQAWIPTLGDILKKQQDSPVPEPYGSIGWQNLEVPSDCPHVQMRMLGELFFRFNERYFNRMLNAETLERWQVRLQNRFDEVVHRYERAYELYQQYEQDMMDDVLEGETYTENISTSNNVHQGGSDSSTGRTRNIDTPDEVVNQSDDYASSLQDTESTVNYGRTDTETGNASTTRTRTVTGASLIENINNSIYDWRDLDTEFVKEFENNFLNIYWY